MNSWVNHVNVVGRSCAHVSLFRASMWSLSTTTWHGVMQSGWANPYASWACRWVWYRISEKKNVAKTSVFVRFFSPICWEGWIMLCVDFVGLFLFVIWNIYTILCLELDSTNKLHKKFHPLPTRFPFFFLWGVTRYDAVAAFFWSRGMECHRTRRRRHIGVMWPTWQIATRLGLDGSDFQLNIQGWKRTLLIGVMAPPFIADRGSSCDFFLKVFGSIWDGNSVT